jgi:hypothetical protein
LLIALALDAVGEERRDAALTIARKQHQALERILNQAGFAGTGLAGQRNDSAAIAQRRARLGDHALHFLFAANQLRARHATPSVLGDLVWM